LAIFAQGAPLREPQIYAAAARSAGEQRVALMRYLPPLLSLRARGYGDRPALPLLRRLATPIITRRH